MPSYRQLAGAGPRLASPPRCLTFPANPGAIFEESTRVSSSWGAGLPAGRLAEDRDTDLDDAGVLDGPRIGVDPAWAFTDSFLCITSTVRA